MKSRNIKIKYKIVLNRELESIEGNINKEENNETNNEENIIMKIK